MTEKPIAQFIDLATASLITEPPTPIASLRHWIAAGRLPSYRPGRKRLIKRAELLAFIETRK